MPNDQRPRKRKPRLPRTYTITSRQRLVVDGHEILAPEGAVLRVPGTPPELVRIEKITPPKLDLSESA